MLFPKNLAPSRSEMLCEIVIGCGPPNITVTERLSKFTFLTQLKLEAGSVDSVRTVSTCLHSTLC